MNTLRRLTAALTLLFFLLSFYSCTFPNNTPAVTTGSQSTESRPTVESDPYVNISSEDFYRDYKPASSYLDSYYRTLHGFMSGSIDSQDEAPTVSENRPMHDGMYVKNSSMLFLDNNNTYVLTDEKGNPTNKIYRGGAYITLDEVAAYIFAFGELPANYVNSKKKSPSESIWGVYLRLNHSQFSGNTQKYPYEPVLPRISGCGGDLSYYEVDIGTTGTTCDPKYTPRIYNNGISISRGAARIVYSRYDANKNKIIDVEEKFLFYTYNHYNDFMEYLNYSNGWGEMFGNITGGGQISSKTDYNPTQYVPSILMPLSQNVSASNSDCVIFTVYLYSGKNKNRFYFESMV